MLTMKNLSEIYSKVIHHNINYFIQMFGSVILSQIGALMACKLFTDKTFIDTNFFELQ